MATGNYESISNCILKPLSHILQASKIFYFGVDFKCKYKLVLNSFILNSILMELNKDAINRVIYIINQVLWKCYKIYTIK